MTPYTHTAFMASYCLSHAHIVRLGARFCVPLCQSDARCRDNLECVAIGDVLDLHGHPALVAEQPLIEAHSQDRASRVVCGGCAIDLARGIGLAIGALEVHEARRI